MDSGFAAFPVIEKKKLVGVISRRDLISHTRARAAIARSSFERRASDASAASSAAEEFPSALSAVAFPDKAVA